MCDVYYDRIKSKIIASNLIFAKFYSEFLSTMGLWDFVGVWRRPLSRFWDFRVLGS